MKRTHLIVWSGIFAALIMVCTAFIGTPVGIGYIHLGDGMIFVCAGVLGPAAVFPAAIGSAAADLITGYAIFAPGTFIIKGVMALISALLLKKLSQKKYAIAFIPSSAFMIAGYFIYECLIFNVSAASAEIVANLIQGTAGVVIGTVLLAAFKQVVKIKN